MDDIGRGELEPDLFVDGQHQCRGLGGSTRPGRHANGVGAFVKVVETPGPAEADHVDGLLLVILQGNDVALVLGGEPEKAKDHDERNKGVEHLDGQVVLRLLRDLVLVSAAVGHGRPKHERPREGPNRPRSDP